VVFHGKWHNRLAADGRHLFHLVVNRDAGCADRNHGLENAANETSSSKKNINEQLDR
jgi:hypothetical protein